MMFCQVVGIIFTVSLKMFLAESSCKISPGDKKPAQSPFGVRLVLNCSSRYSVSFVNASWTRNGKSITKSEILGNKEKTWSAVFLTNLSMDQGVEKFECKILYPHPLGGAVKCAVSPRKPKLRKLESINIFDEELPSDETGKWVCAVESGWPIPTVSWWRNGSKIHNKDFYDTYGVKTSSDGKATLQIFEIGGHHHGKYTCRAENMFGNSTEDMTVLVNRDNLIQWRSDVKRPIMILEGQNITLECTCSSSENECLEGTARPYWRFNTKEVSQTARVRISRVVSGRNVKMIMIIHNVSRIDDGKYLCGINTSMGFDEATRSLQVVTKDVFPRVKAAKREVFPNLNSKALFKCSATFSSSVFKTTPGTFWMKGDMNLLGPQTNDSQRYKTWVSKAKEGLNSTRILDFQLTISGVSLHDYGWYSCGVTVEIGKTVKIFSQRLRLDEIPIDVREDRKQSETASEKSWVATISFLAAVSFIIGVIFVAYRMGRKTKYNEETFFVTSVDSHQFRYDVFITFSMQDSNWVKKMLIPLVEKHNLNYCIHYRDFEAGKPLVDNEAQSVYSSRKVLAVMSQNYLSSKFCRGELEMALYRCAKMGDSSVIVIRIDGIDRSKLPKALRNRTFLDYYDLIERKTWQERLIKHLKPPTEKCSDGNSTKLYSFFTKRWDFI